MLSKSLFRLSIKLAADSIIWAGLFINPNSEVVGETLEVMSSWKQGMSYRAYIDFFRKILRLEVFIDFILSQNLFVKARILSSAFFASDKRSFYSEHFVYSQLEIGIPDSVERNINLHLHAASIVQIKCTMHHLSSQLHWSHWVALHAF